jgi:hypothetical protein
MRISGTRIGNNAGRPLEPRLRRGRDKRASADQARIRVDLPNRLSTRSTASRAVWLRLS